jgi:hypothetical protein
MATKSSSSMIAQHIATLKKAGNKKVEAGWFESDRYPSGIPVAKIARIQETGATIEHGDVKIEIPARAFMRKAAADFEQQRSAVQDRIARRVINGQITQDKALGQLGEFMSGLIAKSIRDGGWQKNAPSTIKGKGFDKPLIDTAHMWQSVNSKVS